MSVRALDLVIEHLAGDEAQLKERIGLLEAELVIRNEFLSVMLERLSQLTLKLERTQDSMRRLLERERESHVRPEARVA